MDLLNEETSKMAEGSRLLDLRNELQIANCSLNSFKFKLIYADIDTNSETLRQGLYGADFNDSDVQLLRDERRPTLNRVRSAIESCHNTMTTAQSRVLLPTCDVTNAGSEKGLHRIVGS